MLVIEWTNVMKAVVFYEWTLKQNLDLQLHVVATPQQG